MHNDSAHGRPVAAKVCDAERHARRELAACYRLAGRMGWSYAIWANIWHRMPGEPSGAPYRDRSDIAKAGIKLDRVATGSDGPAQIKGRLN